MFKQKKAVGGEIIISFVSTITILVALIIFSAFSGIISKVKFRNTSSEILNSPASEQVNLFLESYLNTPLNIIVKNEEKRINLSELIILAATTDNPAYKTKLIDESQNILAVFDEGTETANPECYYLGIERAVEQKRDMVLKIGGMELPSSADSSAILPLPAGGYVNIKMIIDNQCLK